MLTAPDFNKKQIVFIFFNEGEKMALSNSNLVVRKADGSIKFQCTCYRLFLVFAIGHCSVTSALLQAAKKFGFFLAMMTAGFRLYSLIGAEKDGNNLLHRKQYSYSGIDIAIQITCNKISNQLAELKSVRQKSIAVKEAISALSEYRGKAEQAQNLNELLAYEGLASKMYFRNHFNNIPWNGRQPRVKRDYLNATLDIGYTLLFTFIDTLLSSYGFDTYYGVMHRQFYMRKSLTCDLVEPFRPIIDHTIKKGINLREIKESDFLQINGQYRLKWEESSRYVKIFMLPLLENKEEIFLYIQRYYRAFMKELPGKEFPVYAYMEEQ